MLRRHRRVPRARWRQPCRSTKAGAYAPATHIRVIDALCARVLRSTKAGAYAPATPAYGQPVDGTDLDRSTKAGAYAPATPSKPSTRSTAPWNAQQRPELMLRRHPIVALCPVLCLPSAQQRPELMLRRHPAIAGPRGCGDAHRSTKAGAYAPATPLRLHRRPWSASGAQQRPELMLRRHPLSMIWIDINLECAQQRPELMLRRHPGQHLAAAALAGGRSTKAGAYAPATPHRAVELGHVGELRSTKAGAYAPATPCGSLACRRRHGCRSTKAGAYAPATPPGWRLDSRSACTSLNKGRSLCSGDTRTAHRRAWPTLGRAQQRPELMLRRHLATTFC